MSFMRIQFCYYGNSNENCSKTHNTVTPHTHMASGQNTAIPTDSDFIIILAKFLLDLIAHKELATCYKRTSV
jgi:hypothetical protein